ncbi:MAG: ADP-ribosylglycohydrolase family protein [Clostridia bacterium]|nr:ADP-ribosylglycohydrolase family protein [Clostridia bacterium]
MKAWERQLAYMKSQTPNTDPDPKNEAVWEESSGAQEQQQDAMTRLLWDSTVPGSYAKEQIILAAVQALENRGYTVPRGEELAEAGLKALADNDMLRLAELTQELWYACHTAVKDESAPYWNYTVYESFDQYRAALPAEVERLVAPVPLDDDCLDRTHAGWLGQIIGGAFGTAMEGYTTQNIQRTLGPVRDYIRRPNTYNDDITYELVLLKAVDRYGKAVTAADIGRLWAALIPMGWSAEDIALQNLKRGIYPPESGSFHNPYREWIGAQMRGGVVGMLFPGDPLRAARLAWEDGSISHHNNGIMGEVYNAVLVSLAYRERDVRTLLKNTLAFLPKDSEIYSVAEFAMNACRLHSNWRHAWLICEKRFERYNWIHAYPNLAAQIVAMWYGDGDFDQTMHLIGMCGQDVDCNAAQVMNALAVMLGKDQIPERWPAPFADTLHTYVRGMKQMTISGLAAWTVEMAKKLA